MASLDVDVLFTNISLDETIDICLKKLFKTPDTFVKGISKNDFRDLLNLASKESFFTFNNKFYIQVDGVAMESPLQSWPKYIVSDKQVHVRHFPLTPLNNVVSVCRETSTLLEGVGGGLFI